MIIISLYAKTNIQLRVLVIAKLVLFSKKFIFYTCYKYNLDSTFQNLIQYNMVKPESQGVARFTSVQR